MVKIPKDIFLKWLGITEEELKAIPTLKIGKGLTEETLKKFQEREQKWLENLKTSEKDKSV